MTLLAISEKEKVKKTPKKPNFKINKKNNDAMTLDALSHLTQVVTDELTDLQNHLKDKVRDQT